MTKQRQLWVLAAVLAAFTLGKASAQPAIPDGVFVRESNGTVWLVLGGQRFAVAIWPASDEQIAAVPASGQWLVLGPEGGIVAGERPAWLSEQSVTASAATPTATLLPAPSILTPAPRSLQDGIRDLMGRMKERVPSIGEVAYFRDIGGTSTMVRFRDTRLRVEEPDRIDEQDGGEIELYQSEATAQASAARQADLQRARPSNRRRAVVQVGPAVGKDRVQVGLELQRGLGSKVVARECDSVSSVQGHHTVNMEVLFHVAQSRQTCSAVSCQPLTTSAYKAGSGLK